MSKRVLHIRSSGGFLGAEAVVIELARHSPGLGYDPVICVPYDVGEPLPELVAAARNHGIRTVPLPCRRRLEPASLRRLRLIAARERIDIVHTHGYREDIYAALALRGLPLVATNHLWKRTNRMLRLYARIDALALRRFDRVVAVSDPILEDMARAGLPRRKLLRIANGVDWRRFADLPLETRTKVRHEFGLSSDALVIGMVSSLTSVKGHRFALRALARIAGRHPQAHLLIVGDGPEEARLREEVTSLQLGARVRFAGRRSDIQGLLSALDLFLLPSLAEGLPMAMLEAMAAGLPVVASRVGDVGAVIEEGRSGITVPAADPEALATAIDRLLVEPAHARALGAAAAARVRDGFSSLAMAENYCSLYGDCLKERGRGVEAEVNGCPWPTQGGER